MAHMVTSMIFIAESEQDRHLLRVREHTVCSLMQLWCTCSDIREIPCSASRLGGGKDKAEATSWA